MGTTTASAMDDVAEDEDLIEYESIAPELPPASSDRRKWWLDNGKSLLCIIFTKYPRKELTWKPGLPAQSRIQPPSRNSTLNSQRVSNPFTLSNEPDWVIIHKSLTHRGLVGQETDIGAAESGNKRSFSHENEARKTPSSSVKNSSSRELTSEQTEGGLPASLASSVSSSSRVLRDKGPPIPHKPAVLAGFHEQNVPSSARVI